MNAECITRTPLAYGDRASTVGVVSPPCLAGRSALKGGGRGHGPGGGEAREPRGTFVHWAALPGGVAPPGTKVPGPDARLGPPAPGPPPRARRPGLAARVRARRASERQEDQGSELTCRARAKSAPVRPPAECVDKVNVTLFHWISTSGWWLACSAR